MAVSTSIPGVAAPIAVDLATLRDAIQEEYTAVATEPERGFHFHTGRPNAAMLGYKESWLEKIPENSVASFAGTGCPFNLGDLATGERVVDIGCGAGLDSLIAATMVGPTGAVVGVDMTPAMVDRARMGASVMSAAHVDFREGLAESLPVPDGWADVIISNGVLNLFPDKLAALQEMGRVLKRDGRLQIADILVQKAVPTKAKADIALWKG